MTSPVAGELSGWIAEDLGAQLKIDPRMIDVHERFSRYGLDSLGAIALVRKLAQRLDRPISPVAVWRFPTPHALAEHLCGNTSADTANEAVEAPQGPTGSPDEPIAIVGMACRFPGAPSLAAFWQLLRNGVDAIAEVPRERWDATAWAAAEPGAPGATGARRGGFLDQIDRFDPLFFGISPREAITMDPQQRLMLELTWEALEDAGIVAETLKGSLTGVYFGAAWVDYARLLYQQGAQSLTQHTVTGHHRSILANRVSYAFGLQGPSLSLDSACSSSLAAVHLACEALQRGDATMALAGGVNLNLLPESTHAMVKFGALSPDGRCATFDAGANGYVRGEGGAVVVLKRLSRALADGDPISCVIRGSAVNNDGASNGLTAPNPVAQESLLRTAYRRARVAPGDVQYVELHGTGTQLGDPIEASALGAVLGKARSAEAPLLVGSGKTNVGHLEGAAGMVGLLKAALCISHRRLVPSLHFTAPNPHIPFAELNLQMQTREGPWPAMDRPLVAGISSFGMGGTNAHVIVAEWPSPPVTIFPLAASSAETLRDEARGWLEALKAPGREPPVTPALPPSSSEHRLTLTAHSASELTQGLQDFLEGKASPRLATGQAASSSGPKVVFVFAGQGAQWLGMGRSLLHREPVFRATLEQCGRLIQQHLGWSLLDELTAGPESSRLNHVEVGWPVSIAVQIGLTALWRTWGVEPAAVIGHSGGEIAAAHVGGALSLTDAMETICAYARMLARVRGQGAMGLVGLSWEDAAKELAGYEGHLFRAIHHGVDATVLAGEPDALDALFRALELREIFCRRLPVDVAPHSPLVEHLRAELLEALRKVRPCPAPIPISSAALGSILPGERFNAEHWVRNFCEPLSFSTAIDGLLHDGYEVFLEVSPHPSTLYAIQANLRHHRRHGVTLPSLRRDEDEQAVMLDTLGALYALGVPVRWQEVGPAGVPSSPVPQKAALPIPLSARSEAALRAQAEALAAHLKLHPELRLSEVARSLSTLRTHFEHRAVVVTSERAELLSGLEAVVQGSSVPHLVRGTAKPSGRPVFVFPGQGSQWLEMARPLLDTSGIFRAHIEACAEALAPHVSWSLLAVLRGEAGAPSLDRVDVVQPVLFAVMVSLAELWRHLGVQPAAVIGHSQGEIAAACVAGALSLSDAAKIVARRSQALAKLAGRGTMALVELPAAEVALRLEPFGGRLAIAAVNGPRSTVVSGEVAAAETLLGELETDAVFARRIRVDYASHSPQVEAIRDELLDVLAGIQPAASSVPFVSTVNGQVLDGTQLDTDYWYRNLRQTVHFADAVTLLVAEGHHFFIEVSPHPVLTMAVKDTLEAAERPGAIVGSLRRDSGDLRQFLLSLSELFAHGLPIEWSRLHPAGRRVPLPTYAFQRERYWIEAAPAQRRGRDGAVHGLFGAPVSSSLNDGIWLWEGAISNELVPYLGEHVVDGRVIVPGAAYPAMVLDAIEGTPWADSSVVGELELHAALDVSPPLERIVQLALIKNGNGATSFRISSRDSAGDGAARNWVLHASGALHQPTGERTAAPHDVQATQARCPQRITAEEHYATLRAWKLGYGRGFAGVTSVWRGTNEALAAVSVLPAGAGEVVHKLDPRWLDAALQVALALDSRYPGRTAAAAVMPVGWRSLHIHALPRVGDEVWSHARLREAPTHRPLLIVDVAVVDASGRPLLEVEGLRLRRLESASEREQVLRLEWREAQRVPTTEAPATGHWILVGQGRVADGVRERLEARGHTVAMIETHELASDGARAHARIRESLSRQGSCTAVVHLASLSTAVSTGEASMVAASEPVWASALHLTQALTRQGWRDAPRLWFVTQGVQSAGGSSNADASALASAPLLGLSRTLAYEQPELRCTRLDLPAGPSASDGGGLADELVAELLANGADDEITLRGDRRFVARLAFGPLGPLATHRARAGGRPFRLAMAEPGSLGVTTFRELERRAPKEGEVELELHLAALDLAELETALAPASGEPEGPSAASSERVRQPARRSVTFACTGQITAVGMGVSEGLIGQTVVAVGPASETVGTHAVLPAALVAPLPSHGASEDAAWQVRSLMMARHAIENVARAEQGERLLIRSSTGSIGMAAIHVAKQLGLEVLATATTEQERATWSQLGVAHVLEGHPQAFADRILELTEGRGVDIVLDSAAESRHGEAMAENLRVLAPCGRLLELGAPGSASVTQIPPSLFAKGLSYAAVDLSAVAQARPRQFASLFHQAVKQLAAGTLPRKTLQVVPISRAGEAEHGKAEGEHTGERVFNLRDPEVTLEGSAPRLRSDASYVITGGLGGLGLSLARWMFEQGARRLVLAGRSAPTEAARKLARELEQGGATVVLATADVAQPADVDRLLREAETQGAPLRGVFHLAGILDDGLVTQQDTGRFRRVMAPKIDGAWHLHQLTRERPLDFFVLYSSIASLLGSPGQTSYAAANSFLDALAEHRRATGLPGLSLSWGPFSEVGLAAAREVRGERLQDRGMASMSTQEGEKSLAAILVRDEPWVGIVSLDVGRWLDFYPTLSTSTFFSSLIGAAAATPAASAGHAHQALVSKLRATPAQLRMGQLESVVRHQLAKVLQCRPEAIAPQIAFTSLGLESLTGLELRNRLEAETGLRLPATIIWTRGNLSSLTRELLDRLLPDGSEPPASQPTGETKPKAKPEARVETKTGAQLEAELRDRASAMSEEALLAELAQELDEVEGL
ncbi:SDR family NAD(P)-dependent oxidoreductase [Stigmatella sp. ncwal1]|uniref:SDR family NAD(P)-dependent oxidoreductase n=1 Tax=Stigmatella ashevillensis TaxID=2995309 RepID=A0ABT5D6U1_9BACT|nr:type I polyketide synthase [Stigmatella ashevillena]MDC0708573.1 SDR family NAD(P)-dependent oxidoreductase [Stigmatella ashevillena]